MGINIAPSASGPIIHPDTHSLPNSVAQSTAPRTIDPRDLLPGTIDRKDLPGAATPPNQPTNSDLPGLLFLAVLALLALVLGLGPPVVRFFVRFFRTRSNLVRMTLALAAGVAGVFLVASGFQTARTTNWAGQFCGSLGMCIRPEWIAVGAGLLAIAYLAFKRRGGPNKSER